MRLFLAVVGLAILMMQPAVASDEVLCLQRALAGIGFDPGPQDGDFGGRTRQAGQDVIAKFYAGVAEPPFEEANAAAWCKKIGEKFLNVSQFYKELIGEELPAFDPYFSVEGARYESLIDPDYYLAQLPDPSVAAADPRTHYLRFGWRQGYRPSPWFDPDAYLAANPDVAAMRINPLMHYVTKGMAEYRGFGGEPDESGFKFDVGPGVTEKQEALIKQGLAIGNDYFRTAFDRAFTPELMAKITVKLEATKKGNQEPGSEGGNATGLSPINDLLPRPYFDVAHPDFNQSTSGRGWTRETEQLRMLVHELTHGWQAWLGTISMYEQPMGSWVDEGIAEYVGWHAMSALGRVDLGDVYAFQANGARSTGELDEPLSVFAKDAPRWPGHVGFLAISWLVEDCPNGERSLVLLAEALKDARETGASVKQVFRAGFGIELEDFYAQFEPWRLALRANPTRALKKRPELICAATG